MIKEKLAIDRDGKFEITATDAGIYLSVWPYGNGGRPVNQSTVIAELKKRNCTDFDSDFLATIIREALGQPVLIMHSLQNIDGRYQITATDAGIFLSVWPPGSGGRPVAKAAIIKDLEEQNLTNFDDNFLFSIIREALGTPILIINPQPVVIDSCIRVKVSLDRMEARISIKKTAKAPMATKIQLLEELHAAGVVYGIDEQILDTIIVTQSANNIICAYGVLPCNGKDAILKFHVDPECQDHPEEQADGRVDFKQIHHFLCVEEGQLLVEKISATLGEPGINVFGAEVLAKPGKDVRLPVGKNTVSVDDRRLYAAIDGHLHIFLNKRVNVIPCIVVEGDVDYSTGNIDFKGSVIVYGSVQPNFYIKADGNVEVYGSICGGMVEAANVLVHKGIQGMNRSVVKARECLVANFVQNATVYADQDIIISDVILNSMVFAGMRVIVEGSRGIIRGGRVAAGEVIRVCTVGNPSSVVTEVEISVNPFFKEELLQLRQQIKKLEALYQELALFLSHLNKQSIEQITGEKKERYKQKEVEYQSLSEHLEEVKYRASYIMELLSTCKSGRVRVRDTIYPGAKISIGSLVKVINEPHQFVSFYVRDGDIKFSSLQ